MNPEADTKEVYSDPPNILTGPGKKGKQDSILFSKASYNALGDPFKEAALTMVRKEDRAQQIAVGNEKPFRPAKHVRQPTNAAFEHMQDFVHIQKDFRDPENSRDVLIQPRNFLINPPKNGKVGKQTSFGGIIPYMESEYDRPKEIAKKERLHGETLL